MPNRDYFEIDVTDVIGLRPAELREALRAAVQKFEREILGDADAPEVPVLFCADRFDGPRVTGAGKLELASVDFSEDDCSANLEQALTIAALDILLRRNHAPYWCIDTIVPLDSDRNSTGVAVNMAELTTVSYTAARSMEDQLEGLRFLCGALEALGMGLAPTAWSLRAVPLGEAPGLSPEELLRERTRLGEASVVSL